MGFEASVDDSEFALDHTPSGGNGVRSNNLDFTTASQGVPQADETLAIEPTIDVRYVAQAVLFMARLPLNANVQFMTVMATQMPFIGRG